MKHILTFMLFRSLAEQLIYDCKNNSKEQEQINLFHSLIHIKREEVTGRLIIHEISQT